jgi:hypothetical protein
MDDKSKEWFETYKICQDVSDLIEFMDVVEANFGVRDFHQKLQVQLLPSVMSVFGATPLVFYGTPNMLVRMACTMDFQTPSRLYATSYI